MLPALFRVLGKGDNKSDTHKLPTNKRRGAVTLQVSKVTRNNNVLRQEIFLSVMMRGKNTFNIQYEILILSSDVFSWKYLINVYHVISTGLNDKKKKLNSDLFVSAQGKPGQTCQVLSNWFSSGKPNQTAFLLLAIFFFKLLLLIKTTEVFCKGH